MLYGLIEQTRLKYDTSDRLKSQSWQIGNDSFTESYTYDQTYGVLTHMTSGGDTLEFQYNSLKMPAKRISPKLDMTYSYQVLSSDGKRIANRGDTILYQNKKSGAAQTYKKLKYTYDNLDNITWIRDYNVQSGQTAKDIAKYTYDDQNQVTQEILANQTSDYTYDTFGNIRSKKITYSDGSYEQYDYTYGNSIWQDQLPAISYRDTDGTTQSREFVYDKIGNPTGYETGTDNWTFTWQHGRQLATAASGSTSIANTYDVDGIRDSKTVNGVKHSYTTLGGKIVREAYGNVTIDYFYDNNGKPYKLVVKNGTSPAVTGYYVVNLQGDVIAIVDSDGEIAVEYQYDAWGKEISHTSSATDDGIDLYDYNALKYRGYYYDSDLGLYYLNTRFYDAEICRFISADTVDVISATASSLTEKNLYAYCDNNPVVRRDASGYVWETIFDIASLAGSIAEVIAKTSDIWAWAGLVGDVVDVALQLVTGVGEITRATRTTVEIISSVDDVVETAKIVKRTSSTASDIKKSTGAYVVLYEQGQNYIGKGGFRRAITSATEHMASNNKVSAIIWAPTSSTEKAFIAEYLLQSTLKIKTTNTKSFNKIWSPGKKMLQSVK